MGEATSATVSLDLPTDKAGIETDVARIFVAASQSVRLPVRLLGDLQRSEEDDIDFCVSSDRSRLGLELVEFAPIRPAAEAAARPDKYSPKERGQGLQQLIQVKSRKYAGYTREQAAILLVYVTSDRNDVDPFTLSYAQLFAHVQPNVFLYVAFFRPLAGCPGRVHVISPISEEEFSRLQEKRAPRTLTRMRFPK